MIARYCGAMLGLMAFGLATLTGLLAGNSPELILSRALWSLAVFCVIGLALGAAAQAVVNEYEAQRASALQVEVNGSPDGSGDGQQPAPRTTGDAGSVKAAG